MKNKMINDRIQKMDKVAKIEAQAWCPVCSDAMGSINLGKDGFVYYCYRCEKYFKLKPTRFNLNAFLDNIDNQG